MRKQIKYSLDIILAVTAFFISGYAFSQASVIANTSSNSTDFVGWNGIPTFDLDLKHEGNYRMVFGTNGSDHFGLLSNSNDGRFVYNTMFPLNDARFTVRSNFPVTGNNVAIRSTAATGNPSFGGYFTADDGFENIAAFGAALSSASLENYGVAGWACADSSGRNFAVYGQMKEDCFGWAGYFNGPTFTPGAAWTGSDETLKLNVMAVEGGMDILSALSPKSYNFDTSFERLTLPEGLQYGLMAQELEAVLPNSVKNAVGSTLNQEGTFLFKAVDYQSLIPILISAFQERQAELNQRQELIAELEQAIEAAETQLHQISIE